MATTCYFSMPMIGYCQTQWRSVFVRSPYKRTAPLLMDCLCRSETLNACNNHQLITTPPMKTCSNTTASLIRVQFSITGGCFRVSEGLMEQTVQQPTTISISESLDSFLSTSITRQSSSIEGTTTT